MSEPLEARELVDPYLDWAAAEGVPVIEGYGVDLLRAPVKAWHRYGVDGAIIHLKARGDFVTLFIHDLPPGRASTPVRHIYEQIVYVLSGQGSTKIETPDGEEISFEWGPRSMFALPLNTKYRLFNGSGKERARLACVNTLPLVMNYFMNEHFIFNCPYDFPERMGGADWFDGQGVELRFPRGRSVWETNFVPDVAACDLKPNLNRGAGATTVQFILGKSVMKAHQSAMPVGTYKKAHKHGPDFFIFNVTGSGYSLMGHEELDELIRIDWRHGVVFAPPDMMYHQHFNTSPEPARYLAVNLGNQRNPFTSERKKQYEAVGVDAKLGGRQIEYEDQDPEIHRLYLEELAKHGAPCLMNEFLDERILTRRAKTIA